MRAPGTTPAARASANVQLMSPWIACVIVPGIANTPTQAREVAIVSFNGNPTSVENAGTMRMPPPMPSNPDNAPAAIPISPSNHQLSRNVSGRDASGGSVLGKAVRYAVYPTSTAVAIISACPLPGTACDNREPITDAG